MEILSHRGLWKKYEERNSKIAFERSFAAGYGVETDLRDICGKIVISHDMPCGNEITFEELLQIMDGRNLPLALNIKADGMSDKIKKILQHFNHTNYFTFDMSIPDMVVQIDQGLKVFSGKSDIMNSPIFFEKSEGIWLDCFYSDWFGAKEIDELIAKGKKVCIVSAELHGRPTDKQWKEIKGSSSFNSQQLMICTDKPDLAKEFFYGKD